MRSRTPSVCQFRQPPMDGLKALVGSEGIEPPRGYQTSQRCAFCCHDLESEYELYTEVPPVS